MAAQTQLSWMRGYAIVYLCLLGIIKLTTQVSAAGSGDLTGLMCLLTDMPPHIFEELAICI